MKCDVLPFGTWDLLCDQAKGYMGLASSRAQVKIYKGLSHALFEVAQGLAAMVPHKQALAYLNDVSPYFEPLVLQFSRAGFQIHHSPAAVLTDPSLWVQAILKDSVFFLYNDDDPITGRLYPTDHLLAEFKDKRTFRLRVSHSSYLRWPQPVEPEPYEVIFLSISPELCVVILGERARFVDSLAPHASWQPDDLRPLTQSSWREDEERIEAFEHNPQTGLKRFFASDARLYDRAVMYWPDVDGSAALEKLSEKLGRERLPVTHAQDFETTSLCRWPTINRWDWLHSQGVAAEVLRGLMVFSVNDLNDQLIQALVEVRSELLRAQSGS